jgi:hypothetical protein
MTMTISGSTGLTFPDDSVQALGSYTGFKNRIINGAMMIDQRNAGASVTVNDGSNVRFPVDRTYGIGTDSAGVFTMQQSSIAPTGFSNSIVNTVTTADSSVTGADLYLMVQKIEGFNVSDLGFGAAGASTVTLSFWVRSSVTGTFGGSVNNSAQNRSYLFTYTINSANTWEQKTITIVGDTSGTWLKTNGTGLQICLSMGMGTTYSSATTNSWLSGVFYAPSGTTNLISTNGATFYITGVQLEKGSTATSFDYRPYGTELALCQRYLPALNNITSVDQIGNGYSFLTTQALISINHTVTARVPPTGITITNPANISVGNGSGTQSSASAGTFIYGGVNQTMISFTVSGFTIGQGCYARSQGAYQILFNGCEL